VKNIIQEIRDAIAGRHPLLYLVSPEEDRVIAALEAIAAEMPGGARVTTWTCVDGLDGAGGETRSPVEAIRAVIRAPRPGFYVFKDLSDFSEAPDVVRALRNAYHALPAVPGAHLVIVAASQRVPDALHTEVCVVQIPPPDPAELLEDIHRVHAEYPGAAPIPAEMHGKLTLALRGLTRGEVRHVMHRVFSSGRVGDRDVLNQVFAEKQSFLRKAGFLEFIPNRILVEDIGGLEVLKDWAMKRRELFTQAAVDAGLPTPRGILVMGISGCGKSMCAKAIAGLWNLPLFRLDMNLVFSRLFGTPEAAFHRALKTIEAVAPSVLWIDEIENALGMTTDKTTPEQQLTLSTFLTWMQERPPLVFVAATANRIASLPAEIIRKGRFDEVFFCDLPGEEERREIIAIHLRHQGVDPATVDPERLLYATRGWSGAEIEQAVIAARIDARDQGRALTLDDVRRHTARMVPLSRTMEEQIKAIRSWSFSRALRASREAPRSMIPGEG
jgi:hypothetical protein